MQDMKISLSTQLATHRSQTYGVNYFIGPIKVATRIGNFANFVRLRIRISREKF